MKLISILQYHLNQDMRNTKQLYRQNTFSLPQIQSIKYQPFKSTVPSQSKLGANNSDSDQVAEIKPTSIVAYNSQIQIIIGGQNVYPLFSDISETHIVICSKDCFLVIRIQIIEDTSGQNSQEKKSFLTSNIKLGTYFKVNFSNESIPTCMKTNQNHIYFGHNSGKITCYDIARKSFEGSSDQLSLPIMQIQILRQDTIIAIDSAGNLMHIEFFHKKFMDKIIKTLTTEKELNVIYKPNKKQKIKKLFDKIATNKKSEEKSLTDTQPNSTQNLKQIYGHGVQGFPYFYTKFSIPSTTRTQQKVLEEKKIIALYRKNKLIVQIYNNKFQFLEESCLKSDIEQIGMIDFGIGGFQNSNNTHLLLVASIGDKLEYFKGVSVEESYQWLHICSTQFADNILDGKFISNNLLLLLTQKQICICNVNQQPVSLSDILLDKFSYIEFFITQEGLKFDKNLIYRNILKVLEGKNEFICLQGKRMITGKIDSWKDYLQRYVDEEKFNQAMIVALKIYKRNMKILCQIHQKQEIRNYQMKQFFQKITLTYISYQIKKQQRNVQNLVELCIYFLVKTQSCQYLFTTIFEAIKAMNLTQVFLRHLQNYIQRSQIPLMSEQVLNLVIDRYKQTNRKECLQSLIINFDLQYMQKSILFTICMKQQLYQSLIHICCQHMDFISPILKLCGIYFMNRFQLSNQAQQKISQERSQKKQQLLTKKQLLLQKQNHIKEVVFFYIKECLMGHNTEYGNEKSYIQMLIQLINFIFIPNTLDMLMKISTKDTILIVNMFFDTKILQYILENQGKFFIKKNDYIELKIFEDSCINEFRVYEKMLATLIFLINEQRIGKDKELNKQQRELFVFEVKKFLTFLVLKNQFPFVSKYKKQCVTFFIFNTKQIFSNSQQSSLFLDSSQFIVQINAYLMRLLDSLTRSLQIQMQTQNISEQQVGGVQKSNPKNKISMLLQEVLININRSMHKDDFAETRCYILHQQSKYQQVLETYLRMDNKVIRNKIFMYLYSNLNKYKELADQFIKNLDSLISLDKAKTQDLLAQLNTSFCHYEDVIANLNSHPQMQLQYIQEVLENDPFLLPSRKNRLTLLHLQIVVKEKIQQLQDYIQRIDYPLEEAYKICQEKKSKTGKAYLLIKSGRNMQGLLMLCQIFLKSCDEIFKLIAKKKQPQIDKKQQMNLQLQKVLETCQKQYRIDQERGEQIWEKCIQAIFKHLRIAQNMRNQAIPAPIKQILHYIVKQILEKTFSQVKEEFFINKFCKIFPNLPFSVFMIAFSKIFDKMQFTNRLQFLEVQLLQKDETKLYRKILAQSYKGNSIQLICSECKQKIQIRSHQKISSYSCGHIYHKQCLINDCETIQKKLSRNGTCYKCLNETQSFIQCRGNVIQYYSLIQNDKQQIVRKINKLKDFENINKYEYEDRQYEWINHRPEQL